MHTSFLVLALIGPGAAPFSEVSPTPAWQESYRVAQTAGLQQAKPLAVFFGSGADGWEKVTEEKGLTRRARQLLADKFVCCYIDLATADGRKLGEAFEVTTGTGLVVSTKDGDGMAFWHQGDMTRGELEETLAKYSDGRAVRRTEKLDRARYSYDSYPDASMRPQAASTTVPQLVTGTTFTYQPQVQLQLAAPALAPAAPMYFNQPAMSAPMMFAPQASYGGFRGGFCSGGG